MAEDAQVGSLAEETLKLLSALGDQSAESGESCPHGWCPLCRLVEYVSSSPELLEDANEALAKVTAGLMDLYKTFHPDMTNE